MGNNGISGLGGVKVNVSGYGMMVFGLAFGNLLCMVGWEGSMGWVVLGGCFV